MTMTVNRGNFSQGLWGDTGCRPMGDRRRRDTRIAEQVRYEILSSLGGIGNLTASEIVAIETLGYATAELSKLTREGLSATGEPVDTALHCTLMNAVRRAKDEVRGIERRVRARQKRREKQHG
jgi:hypothetical protein